MQLIFDMRMCISFLYAHAHLDLFCACTFHLWVRMLILFWYGYAHLKLECASRFGMCMRISFLYAYAQPFRFVHAHLIFDKHAHLNLRHKKTLNYLDLYNLQ